MHPEQEPYCNPNLLGPLTAEPEVVTGPSQFFAGEEKFFSPKKLAERERLWTAVAPHLERVLGDDETVLHVMPVVHVPSTLHVIGFGIWWSLFFRAAVVLTDKRLVEIFMPDWRRAGTRVCSYSWGQVRKLKLSMGTLSLKPCKGRTQRWKVAVRGDRKLLKLLVPKIEGLLPGDIHVPRTVPLWHCPECGAASEKHPKTCGQCATVFKSPGRAAVLALVFPGGGLFYAGHPLLAVLDLVGEGILFFMVAMFFLTAGTVEDMIVAVVVGVFVLFLTKLESVHLSTILVKRMVPDPRPGRWRALTFAGAAVSLVLMALPPVLSGAFAERLDTDLDLTGNTRGWSGGHDSSVWQFDADLNQRSEWIRDDGQALFVFSMPLEAGDTVGALDSALQADGQQTERKRFGGFECIRSVGEVPDENGDLLLFVRWFLIDREHDDLHIVSASVWPEDFEALESEVKELLQSASWIPVEE